MRSKYCNKAPFQKTISIGSHLLQKKNREHWTQQTQQQQINQIINPLISLPLKNKNPDTAKCSGFPLRSSWTPSLKPHLLTHPESSATPLDPFVCVAHPECSQELTCCTVCLASNCQSTSFSPPPPPFSESAVGLISGRTLYYSTGQKGKLFTGTCSRTSPGNCQNE